MSKIFFKTGRLASSRTRFLLAALALALAPASVHVQAYPSKPIKLAVPFPPGSKGDLSARILTPELSMELGQAIVIDNKAGAGEQDVG